MDLQSQKEKLMFEAKKLLIQELMSFQHNTIQMIQKAPLIGLVTLLKVKVKQLPKMRKLQKFGNLL